MASKVFSNFTDKDSRKFLMIVPAQFAKRSGRCNDNEVPDVSIEDLPVEKIRDAGGETILFDLAVVWVGRAALVAST